MRKLRMSELNRMSTEDFKVSPKHPIAVVLDDVRSILNVGSVFRTSDAFRIDRIHLCGLTPTPPSREMNKTALGATESVSWKAFGKVVESINLLKSEGFKILAVEQTNTSILLNNYPFADGEKIALIFGNEVKGVSNEALAMSDGSIEIPQFGTKHSLNISVSAGITLWHAVQVYFK